MSVGLSSFEVRKRTGVTERQLEHWCRTGAIRPSIQEAAGQGSRRRWSEEDARIVAVMAALSKAGTTNAAGQRNHCLTDLFGRLTALLRTESAGWLVITGGEPVVVEDHLLERAIRAARGGGVRGGAPGGGTGGRGGLVSVRCRLPSLR